MPSGTIRVIGRRCVVGRTGEGIRRHDSCTNIGSCQASTHTVVGSLVVQIDSHIRPAPRPNVCWVEVAIEQFRYTFSLLASE